MHFDVDLLANAVRLYLPRYILTFLASMLVIVPYLKTGRKDFNYKGVHKPLLAVTPALTSFVLVACYYVFIHTNFRDWTSELPITEALRWLHYAGAGELVLKHLGLVLPLLVFIPYGLNRRFKALNKQPKKNMTVRVIFHVIGVTAIAILLGRVINVIFDLTQNVLPITYSGAIISNSPIMLVLVCMVVFCNEVYFRGILTETALEGGGRFSFFCVVAVWLAAAVFGSVVSLPIILLALLIDGAATFLYIMWRRVYVCICFDLLILGMTHLI